MKFKLKIGLIGLLIIGIVLILISGWLTGYLKDLLWSSPLFGHPFPTKKQIIIFTDKTEYKPGELVKITVRNGLGRSIWYNKETCSPFCVGLQKLENDKWKNINIAIEVIFDLPIRASLLKPNEEITREWNMLIVENSKTEIAKSGKYRLSFSYGLSKDNFTEETIYSNEFTIEEKEENNPQTECLGTCRCMKECNKEGPLYFIPRKEGLPECSVNSVNKTCCCSGV
jgi:hypothetical protein